MPNDSVSRSNRSFFEQDPYNFAFRVFCTRWKPMLLKAISFDEATRFNRFTKQLPITEKVLAQNLRELEADGLITRTVYAEVPPRVEYRLTPTGRSVCPILDAIYDWGWNEMKRRGVDIDEIGEMWHGYRERDEEAMDSPYK